MSRTKKQSSPSRVKRPSLESLEAKALNRQAAAQVKGGAGTSGKPVARYHLENAWPSK